MEEVQKYYYFHELYTGRVLVNQIKAGLLTMDIRPGLLTRYMNHKYIEYRNHDLIVQVRVIAIKHYPTMREAVNKKNWREIVPNATSLEEARKYFEIFFSENDIQLLGGVNVIQIKLLK